MKKLPEGQFLENYIKSLKMKAKAVSDKTGIARSTLYTHFKKDELDFDVKKIYSDTIKINWTENEQILDKLDGAPKKKRPRLEAEPAYIASDPNDPENDGAKFEDNEDGTYRMRVPVVEHKAYAGYLRGYQDPEFYEGLDMVSFDIIKKPRGHYLAFEVKGDSMVPSDLTNLEGMALPGWKAVAREVQRHHWQYKLHIKSTNSWIIVHNTEGILIKNIIDHDVENATITIHSLNTAYPDEVLSLNDIAQIFSVVKYIVEA
jgi:phage repressor protein C with HTH and peptisase S24 domain